MDNNNLRRIIIATVISFIFFVAYDYFVLQPQMVKKGEANGTQPQKVVAHKGGEKIQNSIGSRNSPATTSVKSRVVAVIEGKEFKIEVDQWGRVSSFILRQHKFNEKGKQLQLISPDSPKPWEIRLKDEKLNRELYQTPVEVSSSSLNLNGKSQTLTITHKLPSGGEIKKVVTIYPDGHYTLKVEARGVGEYLISPGLRPQGAVDNLTIHGVLVKLKSGKLRIIEDGDAEPERFSDAIVVAGFDRYYTSLFFSKGGFPVVIGSKNGNPVPFVELKGNGEFTGYIGPKYVDRLASIDRELIDVVQYGLGTFFARNLFLLLDWLYKVVHSWALAIILLVILVRLVLFPLTWKGMVSMYKLKELAPKLKEIQEKYKKDPTTLQKKMMELYKKHNANPLGGCLPLLLQIPIFYGIYKLLLYSIELKGAHFLWIKDLSEMDPYFILPILMGITMYLHQKLTPTNFQDPMQEKVFKFLPLLFTFLMATFPAGLVLYWTTNNLLSLLQQWIINKLMEHRKMEVQK